MMSQAHTHHHSSMKREPTTAERTQSHLVRKYGVNLSEYYGGDVLAEFLHIRKAPLLTDPLQRHALVTEIQQRSADEQQDSIEEEGEEETPQGEEREGEEQNETETDKWSSHEIPQQNGDDNDEWETERSNSQPHLVCNLPRQAPPISLHTLL